MAFVLLMLASAFPCKVRAQDSTAVDFDKDIAQIFRDRCISCHADSPGGGLSLTSKSTWLKGGDSGVAFDSQSPEKSSLWMRITAGPDEEHRMPPEGSRLNSEQLSKLRQWLSSGAVWPERSVLRSPQAAARDHWAFQSVKSPVVPTSTSKVYVRNEIDAFVVARLESQNISPASEADRVTLLRRVTLDLTGLPPSTDDVDRFLNEDSPNAYEREVDRLLTLPAYGERWARPWLDLCHFADTDGYLTDQKRPVAWRYRQWLIDALNRDLPFDQFTIEQLAGDLLPQPTQDQLLATGFLRNTLSNREGGADLEEYRVEQIVDRIRTVGTAWLGLTVGCSRCHDHKYDPLTQKEFFQLYAVFDQADEVNLPLPLPGEQAAFDGAYADYRRKRDSLVSTFQPGVDELQKRWENRMLEAVAHPGVSPTWDRQWEVLGLVWGGELGEGQLEGCVIVQTPWEQRTADEKDRLLEFFLARGSIIDDPKFAELKLSTLAPQLEELKKSVPWPTRAPTMRQARHPRPVHIHNRGDFRVPGTVVQAAIPHWLQKTSSGLASIADEKPRTAKSIDRLDLARWLVSKENPLTARVVVNRMWQEFFGRGLVDPSDDFGLRGQKPSHPELLDWLAAEFMNRGWSVKQMHRLIVTSATYRQSSVNRPELLTIDPQNRLLARQMPLRLSSDQVRDAMLFASGLLETRVGGPSVFPPQPEVVAKEGFSNVWKTSEGADRYRRGLYTWIQRLSPFAQNVTFDAPPTNAGCTRRDRSNSPLQALTLLNDPVFFEGAQAMAANALTRSDLTDSDRIRWVFRRAVSREPTDAEVTTLQEYLAEQRRIVSLDAAAVERLAIKTPEGVEKIEMAAWTGLCSVILNLHEFIVRE
ncbi:MAG: PSD1 and planctomycete cytochrome C domain-containing protein [Planctomycetaceae bacterium]